MGPSDTFLVEQKAQTTSQQSPGTASTCEGLTEHWSYDRVPRNNGGVEADRGFYRIPRGNDNRYVLYFDAQIGNFFRLRYRGFWEFNYAGKARDF